MSHSNTALVIGAGPAGTSAAIALRERGIRVHMIDAGSQSIHFPPEGNMLDLRLKSRDQAVWQTGRIGESFAAGHAASPKMRVPGLMGIFHDYSIANSLIASADFHLRGALAAGGMSNAWGCGVAQFDEAELGLIAKDKHRMYESYARVSQRMGISGSNEDALSGYFGLDELIDKPLPLDSLHQYLWSRRMRIKKGFALGRARVAVLSRDRAGRSACDLSGMCLWGCTRRATWSAAIDLASLRRDPGMQYEAGIVVTSLERQADGSYLVHANGSKGPITLQARTIFLAAGTIASTKLALTALPPAPAPLVLRSNPTAAFLLWLPAKFGMPRERAFGLAQLSFAMGQDARIFGNLFSTGGLPLSEFLAHVPLHRRAALPVLRVLLASSIVGNIFFPGELSAHQVRLDAMGSLHIEGKLAPEFPEVLAAARQRMAASFRKLGAWMIPGSFVSAPLGADLHYACTLPISHNPSPYQCDISGELAGLPGVYVVDGASLPQLPAKAHTLTIMANADRIARSVAM